ncbi:hypothetical protein Droror1_Dr00009050 [Drosera rotundifolia]
MPMTPTARCKALSGGSGGSRSCVCLKALLFVVLVAAAAGPALCMDCLFPSNWLSSCEQYLHTGDSQWLNNNAPGFVIPTSPTCCDKFADLKQAFYEANSQFERQTMCSCLRQECKDTKYYNWTRIQQIPSLCGIEPLSNTLVVSRTSPCETLP